MFSINPRSDHFPSLAEPQPQFKAPSLLAWSAPACPPPYPSCAFCSSFSMGQLEPLLALILSQIISFLGLKPFMCCPAHLWQNLSFRDFLVLTGYPSTFPITHSYSLWFSYFFFPASSLPPGAIVLEKEVLPLCPCMPLSIISFRSWLKCPLLQGLP